MWEIVSNFVAFLENLNLKVLLSKIYILCLVALGFLLATLAAVFVQYNVLLIFFGLLLKLAGGVLVISYKYRVSFDKMLKFSEIYTYLHGLKGPLFTLDTLNIVETWKNIDVISKYVFFFIQMLFKH